ncbi:MAG: hypothetical protein ACYC8T_23660 [Myxococcaceae bacterium]
MRLVVALTLAAFLGVLAVVWIVSERSHPVFVAPAGRSGGAR